MATRLSSLLVATLLSALVIAMPAEAATAKRAATCADTEKLPAAGDLADVERATFCLLNAERDERGLRPLKRNQRLARAADRHVEDMVKHRYFAHDSRDGSRFSERIKDTGYLNGPGSWVVGENLAWGAGTSGSAAAIVKAWMASPGHRANVLNGRFRDIGIGLTLGSPRGGDGATYATEFGAVTRSARASRGASRARSR
jgi:uncharacterized protein YkwD